MSKLHLVEHLGRHIVEGPVGEELLNSADDLNDIFSLQYSGDAVGCLLYAENLVPGFFDVSTRKAGELLGKLHNYRSRMAVVTTGQEPAGSRRFSELMAAERRDGFFGIFPDRAPALDWLVDMSDRRETRNDE